MYNAVQRYQWEKGIHEGLYVPAESELNFLLKGSTNCHEVAPYVLQNIRYADPTFKDEVRFDILFFGLAHMTFLVSQGPDRAFLPNGRPRSLKTGRSSTITYRVVIGRRRLHVLGAVAPPSPCMLIHFSVTTIVKCVYRTASPLVA
jgi:hypothetical protein